MSERRPKRGRGTVTLDGIELLAPELLISTGPVDHAAWNYEGLLGWQQRQRFRLVSRLLGDRHFGDLLEIGYGSGVFAPELMKHCARYAGLDVHDESAEVGRVLESVGIDADLRSGSASDMPFDDGSFDGIIGISVLEFVDDIVATCREMARVLRPNGHAFVTVTGDSPVLDLALKVVTGESADEDFADRRAKIAEALEAQFVIERIEGFPRISVLGVQVYRAFDVRV